MSTSGQAPKPVTSAGTTDAEERRPEELREEIAETREELGDTVAAVTEKTDVKKQAKEKVEDVKAQASAKADEVKAQASAKAEEAKLKAQENPPLAIAAAVVGLFVLWRLLRR